MVKVYYLLNLLLMIKKLNKLKVIYKSEFSLQIKKE